MNILLKAATIVDHANTNLHLKKRDIHIKNGRILKIAPTIKTVGKPKIVKHQNLHVSLGWFDTSVSFGEPGYEERETIENGLQTAAKSGFTDIILNSNSNPVPDSSSDIVFLKNAAKGQLTHLHPLGTLTMKAAGENLAELFDMQNAGAAGFYDYKNAINNANLMKIALQYAQSFDGLIQSFPLNKQLTGKGVVNEGVISTRMGLKGIPALAEELQISRDLELLEYTGGKLHIPTISTAGSVKRIAAAKRKGLDLSCSVAIHNLYFTDENLKEFDAQFKVMPPLRTKADSKALVDGLTKGVIDFITSDHNPMNIEKKQVEFDNAAYGTIGLESAFGIVNQLFDLETAIALLTKGRERYALKAPNIAEGSEANLTLFDPIKTSTFTIKNVTSTSKNSMFLGCKLKGEVLGTIHGNQAVL